MAAATRARRDSALACDARIMSPAQETGQVFTLCQELSDVSYRHPANVTIRAVRDINVGRQSRSYRKNLIDSLTSSYA
jgi:hypothetical protein